MDIQELRAFLAGDPETGEIEDGAVNPLVNHVGDTLANGGGVPYDYVRGHVMQLDNVEIYKLAWSCEAYEAALVGNAYANAAMMVAIVCATEYANRLRILA